MSIQLAILHILASHPDGFATIASINADIRMLSGPDWSRKLRELSKRSGAVNIFRGGLVQREPQGWRITQAGRKLLASLSSATVGDERAELPAEPGLRLVVSRQAASTVNHVRARLTLAKTA